MLLQGLDPDKVSVFIDEVLVKGHTFEEMTDTLNQVLSRVEEAGLKIKLNKCQFASPKIEYLGYIIIGDGIDKVPEKI